MSSLRAISTLILGCCFAAMGCAVDAQEPFEGGDVEVPLEEMGFGIGNGLLPDIFWNHNVQATYRMLANGPLANSAGMLPAMPNMTALPASHWKAIQDMVECALPPTMHVTNPYNGNVYVGKIGLASSWMTGPLNVAGRRWVTACLIQRLNAFGVSVETLQEGPHASFPTNLADDAAFPFDESTAVGDAFSSTLPLFFGQTPAFYADVCSETDMNKQCRDVESAFDYRICDTAGALCGLNYLGSCSTACVANGPYWACSGKSQSVRVQLHSPTACH